MQPRALDRWEGRAPEQWRALWRLPSLHILESTTSTNDVVRALAETGAAAGTIVLAEHQIAGRGRMGRQWHDGPGQSLLFSVLLRPDRCEDPLPGTASLRVGLAVARALRSTTGVDVRVKWPNDLVHDDRKLAGILCEAVTTGGEIMVVAGIGLNVKQVADDFPPALRANAASLDMLCTAPAERACVMTAVIDALRPLFQRALEPLGAEERANWADLDALAGRHVILSGAQHADGRARGVAADGALLLETDDGTLSIASATVRVAAPHSRTQQRP